MRYDDHVQRDRETGPGREKTIPYAVACSPVIRKSVRVEDMFDFECDVPAAIK